jgi:regulator of sigma E protease
VPRASEIVPGGAAEHAGLAVCDLVLSADGLPMPLWEDWVGYVRERPGQGIDLRVRREDGSDFETRIVPDASTSDSGERVGRIGMAVAIPPMPEHLRREFERGPLAALGAGVQRTGELVSFTLDSVRKMLQGLISPKNLSGPITIAKVASTSAKSGLESYIGFLALLSVSLGVLNLLPIPVLDGGHLLYYTVELVAGRPVPERIQAVGYQIGLFLVVSLMMLALYNDFARL